jgi:DNA-directed RNA polymerase subunit RPC12/RpoP
MLTLHIDQSIFITLVCSECEHPFAVEQVQAYHADALYCPYCGIKQEVERR